MDRVGVEDWLKLNKVKNYTINEDLSVDVDGDVNLVGNYLVGIQVNFRNVSGNFSCVYGNLTTLMGCPKKVGGNFYCYNNELLSLEGCLSVGGKFHRNGNQ